LRIKKVNLYEALSSVRKSFSASATQKEISLELFYDITFDSCWCDVEIVNKICYNLLANAIKYTPDKGKISIYATTNPDNSILYLSIEDTGSGIEGKELDKIFNRFYQVPGSAGGTGIGLDLCRQLTMIHHGQIKVKSRLGEGTLFTVELPITRDAYSETEIFEDEVHGYTPPALNGENSDWQNARDKPIILLVEDNFELRSYMSSLLSAQAKILVAGNGEEGYKMAFSHVPDIIVSDIMMPVMDGVELTQKCKSEIVTSHIPVILLTAKDGIESEIEGLTYGADDYIRKPFNPTTLKLKINNFIKLTRKKGDENTKESIKKLNERELSFLNAFEKIVMENISTPEFGVDDICRLMFISRMQLYRKMAMIINKKPSQYIKEIKMKKAYELIREKGYNITETMYAVGYTSYTHFSRLFSEVNGETPRKMLGMKEKD
jgi:CheY-like chemotaxis protein